MLPLAGLEWAARRKVEVVRGLGLPIAQSNFPLASWLGQRSAPVAVVLRQLRSVSLKNAAQLLSGKSPTSDRELDVMAEPHLGSIGFGARISESFPKRADAPQFGSDFLSMVV